ncbi:hypothetical protein LTR66_001197 [Elasticomyces elasticus]|nr:hypothetical protein LTR50_003415 [Elasticomyces elasticus]KAK4999854.1 hypothetical protein LTR66_001197 [Elasticomyces elasticus]
MDTRPDFILLQRYLGLRTDTRSVSSKAAATSTTQTIDPSKPCPFPFLSDVIFISIDLEAFEHAHHIVTEVGVAIFDTRSAVDLAPGADAMHWIAQMDCRHLRLSEHAKLVNKRYVKGCPDKFDFGESEWITHKEAAPKLSEIFRCSAPSDGRAGHTTAADSRSKVVKSAARPPPRNIVLVGHGLKNDIDYLKSFRFSPYAAGNIIKTLDTQRLASSKSHTVGLKTLLVSLGVEPVHLHNAGNDAAYTLQALILMALKAASTPGGLSINIMSKVEARPKEQPENKGGKALRRQRKLARRMEMAAARGATNNDE